MYRILAASLFALASTCSRPSTTTPPPPATNADAGVPASGCVAAFNHQAELSCPPEEDASDGWVTIECPKLTAKQVADIIKSHTCVETRQAQETP